MDDFLIEILKATDQSEQGAPRLRMDDFLIRILNATDQSETGSSRAPNGRLSN